MVYLKKIRVSNFKNFQSLKVNLSRFNVLVGQNASGKSNFIEIFNFLKDIVSSSLGDAISKQGGLDYLKNINSTKRVISVKLDLAIDSFSRRDRQRKLIYVPNEVKYEFAIRLLKNDDYVVQRERLHIHYVLGEIQKHKKIENYKELGIGTLKIFKKGKKVKTENNFKSNEIISDESRKKIDTFVVPFYLEGILNGSFDLENPNKSEPKDGKSLFFGKNTLVFVLPGYFTEFFEKLGVYDFDPKRIKKSAEIGLDSELHRNADNFAVVLGQIISDEDRKRNFLALINDLLPFVEDVKVDRFIDKSLLFKFQEVYNQQLLPSGLLSDGTVNIAALVVALYFEQRPFIILEEPERNIHPSLTAKLMQSIKDASKEKQIIVTTHSPEVLRWTAPEDILFISRGKDGNSRIYKANSNAKIREFLKNDIGLNEVFVEKLF